jgi:hypothetical protein
VPKFSSKKFAEPKVFKALSSVSINEPNSRAHQPHINNKLNGLIKLYILILFLKNRIKNDEI